MKNTEKYAWSFSRNSSFLRGLFYYAVPCRYRFWVEQRLYAYNQNDVFQRGYDWGKWGEGWSYFSWEQVTGKRTELTIVFRSGATVLRVWVGLQGEQIMFCLYPPPQETFWLYSRKRCRKRNFIQVLEFNLSYPTCTYASSKSTWETLHTAINRCVRECLANTQFINFGSFLTLSSALSR